MEPKGRAPYKRKKLNLTVKREFQFWLLVRMVGVVLLSTLMAVLILYLYSRQEISDTFYSAHIQLRRVSDLLLPVMAAGAFISLLSGLALALFLPQKLAGPIYRIQKGLDRIKEGDLTEKIVLRKNDAFEDLAASVNATTESIRSKVLEVKKIQQEVDTLLAGLKQQEAAIAAARQKAALAKLRTEQ